MKGPLLSVPLAVLVTLVMAGPACAHHSNIGYDREHPITLTGVVTKYVFTAPHTKISFDVKGKNGVVTNWTIEAGPPHKMYKDGWTRDSLKPGDIITVTGGPSKNGSHEIFAGGRAIKIHGKN